MEKKIQSLAPAIGWWAGYGDEKQQNFHRVVAFALCEFEGEQTIEAVDAVDFHEGSGVASDSSNFRGIYHETDFEVVGETLNSGSFVRFLRGGGY